MLRLLNKGYQFAIDVFVLSCALWFAYALRFELEFETGVLKQAFFAWPYIVLLEYLVLALFGVPRLSWRFFNLHDAQQTVLALLASSAILVTIRLVLPSLSPYSRFVALPLSVLGMNFLLANWGVIGVRMLRRLLAERGAKRRRQSVRRAPVPHVLIGAGEAGAMVAGELTAHPEHGVVPVAFIDDDPLKLGSRVRGIPVRGGLAQLPALAERHGAKHAIITIANSPGKRIRQILRACREAGLKTRIIPPLDEILRGDANAADLREVAIEDLLGRSPVELDPAMVAKVIQGRTVLLTGAGGSIGSELCRQTLAFAPKQLVLVDKSENALFEIHRELAMVSLESGIDCIPCLADIGDKPRMGALFSAYRPEVVLHAAAHKHVPMMEWNPGEAIKANVLGTKTIADLADKWRASHFVTVSTDKAVNPSSVMGATKRVAEIYTQALSQRSDTRFVAVRFGNVLGSAGSVVPIFREQIAAGGPVTVTDPDMTRYFMTIPESCQLVLQAAALGEGGEIFVLDMGEPIRIVDLARDLIALSGLEPDVDIPIVFTGTRPGEKLFEELSVDAEQTNTTKHPKIFVGKIAPHDWSRVVMGLTRLGAPGTLDNPTEVRRGLADLVPEFAQGTQAPESRTVA